MWFAVAIVIVVALVVAFYHMSRGSNPKRISVKGQGVLITGCDTGEYCWPLSQIVQNHLIHYKSSPLYNPSQTATGSNVPCIITKNITFLSYDINTCTRKKSYYSEKPFSPGRKCALSLYSYSKHMVTGWNWNWCKHCYSLGFFFKCWTLKNTRIANINTSEFSMLYKKYIILIVHLYHLKM